MDSRDWDLVQRTLQRQTRRLNNLLVVLTTQLHQDIAGMADRQVGLFTAMSEELQQLSSQFQRISPVPTNSSICVTQAAASPLQLPSSSSPLLLAKPDKFLGDSGDCRSFLTKCELFFELQAPMFLSD